MGSAESGRQFSSPSKDAFVSGGGCRNFAPKGTILLLFYVFFAALLVMRRPDCIRNPQFWAEEGTRFFVDARARSIWINLATYSYGYFDLLVRSILQVAALVPLEYAPLVLVLSAIAIQAAIPTFVISARCANWMGIFPIRLAAALLYCGLPNSFETHCIALHARVHLAVLAALVIVSAPPLSRLGKLFDASILTLTAFSGPFVLLLAPAAIWRQWCERTSAARRNCLILVIGFIFAIFAIIGSGGQRFRTTIGRIPAGWHPHRRRAIHDRFFYRGEAICQHCASTLVRHCCGGEFPGTGIDHFSASRLWQSGIALSAFHWFRFPRHRIGSSDWCGARDDLVANSLEYPRNWTALLFGSNGDTSFRSFGFGGRRENTLLSLDRSCTFANSCRRRCSE